MDNIRKRNICPKFIRSGRHDGNTSLYFFLKSEKYTNEQFSNVFLLNSFFFKGSSYQVFISCDFLDLPQTGLATSIIPIYIHSEFVVVCSFSGTKLGSI
jgi:hypothetical protein